jgi:hypothetical protein
MMLSAGEVTAPGAVQVASISGSDAHTISGRA